MTPLTALLQANIAAGSARSPTDGSQRRSSNSSRTPVDPSPDQPHHRPTITRDTAVNDSSSSCSQPRHRSAVGYGGYGGGVLALVDRMYFSSSRKKQRNRAQAEGVVDELLAGLSFKHPALMPVLDHFTGAPLTNNFLQLSINRM